MSVVIAFCVSTQLKLHKGSGTTVVLRMVYTHYRNWVDRLKQIHTWCLLMQHTMHSVQQMGQLKAVLLLQVDLSSIVSEANLDC